MALSFVSSRSSGSAPITENIGSAENFAALLQQLRNFATVGLCNGKLLSLILSISQGMPLAIL